MSFCLVSWMGSRWFFFLAMGAGYAYIVGLYVVKVLAIALTAATSGFVIGSHLSLWLLSPVLAANTRPVSIVWAQLPGAIGLTCLVAVAAAVLPTARLLCMDPTVILIEE